jgi:hypothetical protein
MVEENTDRSDSPVAPRAPQATPLPAGVGHETRVAMDLAGIQGVQRRQAVVVVIVVVLAVVAAAALVYAIV